MLRKYPKAPHPFVLEPPEDHRESLLPGERFHFSLVLIGKGMDYLPYFIYSIHTLGQMGIGRGRGKFALRAVYEDPLDGSLQEGTNLKKIYDQQTQTLEGPSRGLTWEELLRKMKPPSGGQITLHFRTPVRMRYQGRYVDALEFHILVRNLLRRISSLSYFHCGRQLDLDFKGLIRLAQEVETEQSDLRWHDWERYSARQRSRMKMGGIVGTVTFRGDIRPFWPYMVLGQTVHVGKGTSFGLGKYEIVQDSCIHV
jgi:CRISPR-associated endoribonuclease Cas6